VLNLTMLAGVVQCNIEHDQSPGIRAAIQRLSLFKKIGYGDAGRRQSAGREPLQTAISE
jgi:hypothetical protein